MITVKVGEKGIIPMEYLPKPPFDQEPRDKAGVVTCIVGGYFGKIKIGDEEIGHVHIFSEKELEDLRRKKINSLPREILDLAGDLGFPTELDKLAKYFFPPLATPDLCCSTLEEMGKAVVALEGIHCRVVAHLGFSRAKKSRHD